MAKLVSVNVGLPQNVEWSGRTVFTGIWKTSVLGARMARKLNIEGDGQGDLKGHGGEHRAVYVYQLDSYRHWEKEFRRNDFAMGQFGENLTVEGLSDDAVCIGDRYRIGTAVFEVTQPRVTCYRIGLRMNEPRMAALLVSHSRPGFYFRVLEEGQIQAGDTIEMISRYPSSMTVAEVNSQLYLPDHERGKIERAIRIPALSQGWRSSFQALLSQGGSAPGNVGLTPPDAARMAWSGFRRVRIAALKHETADVVSVELETLDGADFAAPLPGQFLIVKVQPPTATSPVLRSFSICDTPRTSTYRLGIKCEPHAIVGTYLRDVARVGDTLDISAPRGSFVLQPGDDPVTLISAGIGITPVLAMLRALAREASARRIAWLYAARNGAEHPFASEVRTRLAELPGAISHTWYSNPRGSDVVGRDFQSSGHLDIAGLSAIGATPGGDFYLCGPPSFLRDIRTGLLTWGVAAERVHNEIFGAGPSSAPGVVSSQPQQRPHVPNGPAGAGPAVSFARSGLVVPWSAKYRSLLELAEASDVPVRWSCRTGVCHQCESGLISGTPTYDPAPLDPPASGRLLICCSTPKDEIVLDL
ncbi:MAG TPA: MOSC and FAD-binding oxidoreductase domain-containing protein [Candidatus Acidoferrales bacterium]|nr:MOSC and FAD-binding oxidoreductase domain-containing protein [Candidatus Acidoferrales bacterium]